MDENKNALGFKKPVLANETTRLDFGKYKGETVGEVMKKDAGYLLWALDKNILDVEPHVLDDISELAEEQDIYDNYYDEWRDVDD